MNKSSDRIDRIDKDKEKEKSGFSRQSLSKHKTADNSSRYSTHRKNLERFAVSKFFHESIKPINYKIFKITTYMNKLYFYFLISGNFTFSW